MFSLARRFGIPLSQLIAVNPHIPDPSLLFPCDVLCVPAAVSCPPGFRTYTVQPGDSMFSIARRFGITLDALIAANPQIPNPNVLFPGDVLCVPQAPACPPGSQVYTVRPGDTMFTIAQRFGVSLDALIAANPQIPNPAQIFAGDVLCIPPSSISGAAAPSGAPETAGEESPSRSQATDPAS
ncbi:MAG: LysM peptidoglycan-binding domain-containing protein [Limnochordaceae bacterium]|nr:LysM peptidoglycan-binding domain-containing protein [Limnochordaceae bacterium]